MSLHGQNPMPVAPPPSARPQAGVRAAAAAVCAVGRRHQGARLVCRGCACGGLHARRGPHHHAPQGPAQPAGRAAGQRLLHGPRAGCAARRGARRPRGGGGGPLAGQRGGAAGWAFCLPSRRCCAQQEGVRFLLPCLFRGRNKARCPCCWGNPCAAAAMQSKPCISVNHFDADAVLSMWAFLNRPAALQHSAGEHGAAWRGGPAWRRRRRLLASRPRIRGQADGRSARPC